MHFLLFHTTDAFCVSPPRGERGARTALRPMTAASSVSLEDELARLGWFALRSLREVCGYNKTPAARSHSAPFSEEKPLMALCLGPERR